MTMPSSGVLNAAATSSPISVAYELALGLTTTISMNDAAVRTLAGVGATGTQWSMSSLYGQTAVSGIFFLGQNAGVYANTSNTLTPRGVFGSDINYAAGTVRQRSGALSANYGTNKGIFSYGTTAIAPIAITNLVSSKAVVAADIAAAGTPRELGAATSFGSSEQAIYVFGGNNSGGSPSFSNVSNIISSAGVVAADTTGVGTARWGVAACRYGSSGAALCAYGRINFLNALSTRNPISTTGVVSGDAAGVGTARAEIAAVEYGGDKGIFGYGTSATGVYYSLTNLMSNTGVIATDTAGVGTARNGLAACKYGTNTAVFAFGYTGSVYTSNANYVSSTGVVAADVATSMAARVYASAAALFS